jgi:hypothetical protein
MRKLRAGQLTRKWSRLSLGVRINSRQDITAYEDLEWGSQALRGKPCNVKGLNGFALLTLPTSPRLSLIQGKRFASIRSPVAARRPGSSGP